MIKEMVERWKREQTTTKEYVKKLHVKIDEEEKCSSAQSNIDSQIANLMQKKETVQREVTVAESNLREMQDLHTATKMQLMQFHERRAEEMNSRDLGRRAEDAERIPLLEQQISVYMEDWKSERTDKERALVKANELEQKVEQMQNMLKHYQDAEDAYNEVRRRSSAHRDVLRSAAYPTGRDHDVVRRSGSYAASGDSFRRSGSHNSSVLEYNIPMSASNQACVVSRGTSPVVTVRCNLSPRASLYVTDDLDFDSTPGATGTSSPRITTPCGSRAASVSPRHSTIIVEDVTSDKEDVYGAPPDNERFLHCPKCTRPYPENRHDELVEHFELCSEVDH
ncbi:PREDICTED: uncharacterized protein LOC106810384 isoform X2 [Priapulus caudatus]|nr:PREDICTED: uncharacterized protein LOC106810384 isoform X2 [Priapulus caudatus]XP_014669202.1 PREDICTED: uncharacterized protein LOC106810384 isoform X2 [Priapulus caudatus]XP_014669203.1 PREDICTED: uncharacterized protein LOC106810384 isoform X2 [Priapulus caudatus]